MDMREDQAQEDGEIDLAHAPGFALGELSISPPTREVRWPGGAQIVEPRVMQALVCLAQARGAVVSRDDLIRRCWGGRIVGEDAINRCVAKVRFLADLAGDPAFIVETIPRVGYRLKGSGVEVDAPESISPAPAASVARRQARWPWALGGVAVAAALVAGVLLKPGSEPLPSLRTLAILPIRNLTGDPSLDAAVDRLTEDTMEVTGRGGYIVVAPRNATFAWKAKAVDEREVGRVLGVRNLAMASLRREGARWRLSFQLVDTADGRTLVAHDFDRTAPDGSFPEAQLSLSLFNAVAHVIWNRWQDDQLARPADDSDLDNLVARALRGMEAEKPNDIARTTHLIQTAFRTLPKTFDLLPELAQSACWYYSSLVRDGYYASRPERTVWAEAALAAATTAGEARPIMTGPHSCRAEAFALLGRWDEGLAEARYVIETYPLTATGYEAKARLEVARGAFRDALADYAALRARDVDSVPDGSYYAEIGLARLLAGDLDPAIDELRRGEVIDANQATTPFLLAAALELAGKHDDAVAEAALYARRRTGDGAWEMLEQSRESAFAERAEAIRAALHAAGIDEPQARLAAEAN